MPIIVVIDADAQGSLAFHGFHHRRGQLEAQKMHGRSLFVVRTFHVFVGDGKYPLHFAHPNPASRFHTDQFLERGAPLVGIGKLQQQGDLPIAAVGEQRIVSVEFALDAVAFENPLASTETV